MHKIGGGLEVLKRIVRKNILPREKIIQNRPAGSVNGAIIDLAELPATTELRG